MTELKFKCTLLSDVILNSKYATTGPNETLDFIPGNNFLGIVAGKLYGKVSPEEALTLFHSGKVRFGDAHPSVGNFRGLKVPASMFYPKLKSPDQELYIHHLIPEGKDMSGIQLKQCRGGFFDFSSNPAKKIATKTNFAIKSAYDRDLRRSKDKQLFGYQSLQKGLVLYFSVEVDNSADSEKIKDALVGLQHIGRSRTAQYGLVKIECASYNEIKSNKSVGNIVTVYADSRLIFLDDYGQPTFRPTAEQLGLTGGKILWEKTQIRTFRYAPWNFKRQCFDTDRCGIEKGSVFVVRLNDASTLSFDSRYIGMYKNEGFGRVIYNPSFLDANDDGNAIYNLIDSDKPQSSKDDNGKELSSPLLEYLRHQETNETENLVHGLVNDWVEKNKLSFKGDSFASQWGEIRSIAAGSNDYESLQESLFGTENGYLTHGIKEEKWKVKGRLTLFRDFVNNLDPAIAKKAIVNLAAEMAKK